MMTADAEKIAEDLIEVRIINLDGSISAEVYVVSKLQYDRFTWLANGKSRGTVSVTQKGTRRTLSVDSRRIIPNSDDGAAIAIVGPTNCYAVCPVCGALVTIASTAINMECPQHGRAEIKWWGQKPGEKMIEESTATTATATIKARQQRPAKLVKTRILMDKDKLREIGELYTKAMQFNHPHIEAFSHVLVITSSPMRMAQFNSYDGAMATKQGMSVDDLMSSQKCRWHPVEDLALAQKRLLAKGYTKEG